MLLIVLSAALLIPPSECGPRINELIDNVLAEAQDEVRLLVKEEIAEMPDLEKSWSKNLWPFRIGGQLKCIGGNIGYVGPFERVDDVIVKWDWGVVGFQATLLFKEIRMSYQQCHVSLGVLKTTDPLRLTTKDIKVKVQLSLSRNRGRCVNYIEHLEVREFGELEADMGRGVLSNIKEAVLEYYVRRYHDTIVAKINKKLETVSINAESLVKTCERAFHAFL